MSWKMNKQPKRFRAFKNSFLYAFRGIRYCIAHERNMRVHLSAAVLVTAFSVSYGLTALEYGMLFFAVGLVLCAEALNTGIEQTVNLVTREQKRLAGIAKDCAAAGVLLAALTSVAIGCALFLHFPKLTDTLLWIVVTPGSLIFYLALFILCFLFSFWGDKLFRDGD